MSRPAELVHPNPYSLSSVTLFSLPPLPTMPKDTTRRRQKGSSVEVDAKQAVDLATAQTYSENVFLFVPNLIGSSSSSRPLFSGL